MLPATASPLEVTWTAVAVGGLLFTLILLGSVYRSVLAVNAWILQGRAYRWGPRHKFVLGFFIGIALLVLVWLGFVLLGVNAMVSPPPMTPDREAASERGGWILVSLESLLLMFQVVLLYAWVAVGGPSLHPPPVSKVET